MSSEILSFFSAYPDEEVAKAASEPMLKPAGFNTFAYADGADRVGLEQIYGSSFAYVVTETCALDCKIILAADNLLDDNNKKFMAGYRKIWDPLGDAREAATKELDRQGATGIDKELIAYATMESGFRAVCSVVVGQAEAVEGPVAVFSHNRHVINRLLALAHPSGHPDPQTEYVRSLSTAFTMASMLLPSDVELGLNLISGAVRTDADPETRSSAPLN